LLCASDASRGTPAAKTLGSRIALSSAGSCSITKDWDCVFRYTTEATALGAGVAADSVRSSAMTSIRADVDVASAAARTEKDRVRRVSYQRAAIGLWTKYMLPEGGADPHELTVLKNANAADQQVLARAEAVALKKQQAEELRAQQRAAAEERQRLASEARTRAREEAAERRRERTERLELQQPSRSCCKVCSSGCACGDSCISCSKTCHKGRGCAC
ncbi:MAG: hypothetical protein JWP01_2547, partial [Myxococcales bacterium]|nr:hypothetical protein [Myxococcales bacterium]